MLAEPAAIFSTWFALARKYRVSGKHSHDLRLVATMKELGIEEVVTFNIDDFNGFAEITAVHPATLGVG
jgi:predicted nucleic acid-binding protein